MKKTLEEAASRTRGDIDSYQTKYASKVKSSLPSKDDLPVMGIRSNKNFITSNAVEAILQGIIIIYFYNLFERRLKFFF
jgi:hypothetical protein